MDKYNHKDIAMKFGRMTLLLVSAWVLGCGGQESPKEKAAVSPAVQDTALRDHNANPLKAGQTVEVAGNAEECCTQVGKKDQCWWEDAVADGITCTVATASADCISNQCYVEPGATRGVCKCSSDSQCNDGINRHGVCHETVVTGAGSRVCGPSYCNGYYKCSCYGGCEWWSLDENYTPAQEADDKRGAPYPANDGNYCCEGTYPLGGTNPIAYYSNADNCDGSGGAVVAACTLDADCNDGNDCTADSCNAGTCQHISNTGAVCGIGIQSCSAGTCDSYGVCQTVNYPLGTACGSDHAANPCWDSDFCDGAGACDTDNYVPSGTVCGNTHAADECWNADQCDGAGACDTANYVPDGSACGSTNATDACLNQDICASGFCVNDVAPVGTVCTPDTAMYPPSCYVGTCVNPPVGYCSPTMVPAANDNCATGAATYLGHFNTHDTGVLGGGATVGSLLCATNSYSAGGEGCVEGASGNALGYDTKDVIFSFTYDTPDTTTDNTAQQYAFIVKVESDVQTTVYAYSPADGTCPTGGAIGNRCISQHRGDNAGSSYVWEYAPNTEGNSWDNPSYHDSQACSSTPGTGYWWCDRGGVWSAPPDITPCDAGTCNSATSYPAGNISQTVVYPRGPKNGGTYTVYVVVDGSGPAGGANDGGNFALTVEKVALNNGPCERINDDPRVYDVTEMESGGSFYLGNFEGVANSDHEKISDQACGGYDCAGAFTGLTPDHDPGAAGANEFWPNSVHYKIHRPVGSGSQPYCIRTEAANSGSTDTVVEVRAMTDPDDICGSDYVSLDSAFGANGVSFTAAEGVLYEVLVSEYNERTTPCLAGDNDCNYKLVVEPGPCPPTRVITTNTNCVATPAVPNSCTALGVSGAPVAGEVLASAGDNQYIGIITSSCNNLFDITSSNWPGKDGPDTVVLLTNDTAVDKQVSIEFYDHELCNTSYCNPAADLFSAVYTCGGAVLDWPQQQSGAGKAVAPDTCVPAFVQHTEHTVVIPAGETVQFIGTAWSMGPTSPNCDAVWNGPDGMGYHLDVTWTDTVYSNPGQGVCEIGGYEFPVGSGICWYKGTPSVSCDTVCAGYSGCNLSALQTYGQDTGNCATIIDNLWGLSTGGTTNMNVEGTGTSCVIKNFNTGAEAYYVDSEAATCDGSATVISRACPCTAATGAVECTPGQSQCVGLQYQTCDATGHWANSGATCDYACDDSTGCYGVCSPGQIQCADGANYQVCNASYEWDPPQPCAYFCDQTGTNQCAGECNAPDSRCNGQMFQSCNASHYYVDSPPACSYGCDDTTGCYGNCSPANTRCVDANHVQLCDNNYDWGTISFCSAGCDQGGTEQCNAACPGSGQFIGGYCWYLTTQGQSCNDICSVANSYGGVNDATMTYAGSSGSNANCQGILDAFGQTMTNGVANWNSGLPCHVQDDGWYVRPSPNATNYSASAANARLACACNQGSIECTVGDGQCVGNLHQICVAPGFWVTDDTCAYGCDGATGCFGNCLAGQGCIDASDWRQCVGNFWQTTTCPYFCDIGFSDVCAGECNGTERKCTGTTTYHDCDGANYWAADQSCAYACIVDLNGPGLDDCGGVCVPGTYRCNGADREVCNNSGAWVTDTTCATGICDTRTNDCGVCDPMGGTNFRCAANGTDREQCDALGGWAFFETCAQACIGGVCSACTPGDYQCSGQDLQQCDATGSWQTINTCSGYCDATAGNCKTCKPGDYRCSNSTTLQLCDASGNWQYNATCSGTLDYCLDSGGGTAACVDCQPGAQQCSGSNSSDNLETCDGAGSWQVSTNCGGLGCTSSPLACKSCVDNTFQCNGNILERCQNGSWVTQQNCGANTCNTNDWGCDTCTVGTYRCTATPSGNIEYCNPSNGDWSYVTWCATCIDGASACAVCTPGDYQCNGANLEVCSAVGQWTVDTVCALGCNTTASPNACNICTPGTYQCNGDNSELCDTDGTWIANATCGAVIGCNGTSGQCNDCGPASSTQCVNTTDYDTCQADQTWAGTPVSCPYVCSGGACSGVCSPGTTQCANATDEQTCDANGNWGAATTCTSGTCSGNACVPGCQPAACASATEITSSWSYDGMGPGCVWFSTANYINAWSTMRYRINGGTTHTDGWTNTFGKDCNGKYYVEYDGDFNWSHIEISK